MRATRKVCGVFSGEGAVLVAGAQRPGDHRQAGGLRQLGDLFGPATVEDQVDAVAEGLGPAPGHLADLERDQQATAGGEHPAELREHRRQPLVGDLWWHDLVDRQSPEHEAQPFDAEHPLYIMYASGTTAKPKAIPCTPRAAT